MRFKTKTDYCIRVLIYLQLNRKKVRIQDIADDLGVSKNHLSVAVNKLSELGYVNSSLGPKGGVEFNKKSENKTVGELIFQIEDFDVVECFDAEKNTCSLTPRCKLKGMLSKATSAFLQELKKHKIKDLV